ncbi:hypothetical protein ACRCPS_18295 [Pseudomonas aeruginosa]
MQNQETKLIAINLGATLSASYTEIITVPADITDEEIDDLVRKRWETVGGDEFVIEEESFSRGDCYSEAAPAGAVATLTCTRVDDALVVEELPAPVPAGAVSTAKADPAGLNYIEHPEALHTIIAALRFWQEKGMCDPFNRSDEMQDLATGGDEVTSLCDEDLDHLVMDLNKVHDPVAFAAELQAKLN